MSTDFNGWKNKETWLVNVWLVDALADDLTPDMTIEDIAGQIEQLVDEMASAALEEGANGFITDMLNCALGEIDYRELAGALHSDM